MNMLQHPTCDLISKWRLYYDDVYVSAIGHMIYKVRYIRCVP